MHVMLLICLSCTSLYGISIKVDISICCLWNLFFLYNPVGAVVYLVSYTVDFQYTGIPHLALPTQNVQAAYQNYDLPRARVRTTS